MADFRFRPAAVAHVAAYYSHRANKPGSASNLHRFLHNARCYLAAARGVTVASLPV